jgi:hypothetical protein
MAYATAPGSLAILLAILAAILRASSLLSNLAGDRRPGSSSKYASLQPDNALSRDGEEAAEFHQSHTIARIAKRIGGPTSTRIRV